MEQSKAEILSELYSVRSVLSIVSRNEDEVNYINNNEISPRKQTIDSIWRTNTQRKSDIENQYRYECGKQPLREEIARYEEEIEKKQGEINNCRNDIPACEKRISGFKSEYKHKYYKSSTKAFFIAIIAMLLVITFILVGYGIAENTSITTTVITYSTCYSFAIVISVIICIIYGKKVSKKIIDYINFSKQRIIELNNQIVSCEQIITKCKDKITECNDKIREIDSIIASGKIYTPKALELNEEINNDQKVVEELKGIINQKIDKIKEIKAKSEQLIENAKQAYQVVDFRDWRNIDLLIFYFETGRADTVKEALYQVDRERQNQSLVGALQLASSQICKTIDSSISALSGNLEMAFNKLNNTIRLQNEETRISIGKNMAKSNALLQQQREETARLVQSNYSAQEMNRALLEKISTSSDRLVNDMESQLRAQGISYYI
ncbi:MAG: hypothetical protein ACI4MS_06280 [Candidatus Coproplasma sp.]